MVLRLVVRRAWVALLAFTVVPTILHLLGAGSIVVPFLGYGVLALMLNRLGLVAAIATVMAGNLIDRAGFAPTHFGAWDGWPFVITVIAVWTLGAWAFHTALAGRRVLAADLLED